MMPEVTYVLPDESTKTVDVEIGQTLMRAAKLNGIDDIVADCGGTLSCASCHVYVEQRYISKLPAPHDNEHQMLDFVAAGRTPESRLSCQLVMKDGMEGMTVRIAFPQL